MKKEVSILLVLTCIVLSFTTFQSCLKEDDLPIVTTFEATNITTQSALLGGNVTDNGGAVVEVQGFCWGTANNPSIENSNKRFFHGGTGSFDCEIFNLVPNTYYHVRAFAMNRTGIAYGNEVHFTTSQAETATVRTIVVSQYISYYGASVEICISNDGGVPITEKGICWATSKNPTINNDKDIYDCPYSNGDIYCWGSAYPLKPKTNYHVRAYAVNWIGISYGNDLSFTTLAVPEVTTITAIETTNSSAIVGGNVTSIGDARGNIETGICYGINKDPAIDGPYIESETTGTGEFTCKLTNLAPGTLYYVRAYVRWDIDAIFGWGYTVYGNEVVFTTSQ